jgi:hypothetical protein
MIRRIRQPHAQPAISNAEAIRMLSYTVVLGQEDFPGFTKQHVRLSVKFATPARRSVNIEELFVLKAINWRPGLVIT